MALFTVHARGDAPDAIGNAVLVREGFSRAALVFGPLWLLRFRLWLATILWLVIAAALVAATSVLTGLASVALFILFAALTGLEANAARRRGLVRRGFAICDVVTARDRDAAERRFFDRRAAMIPTSSPARPAGPVSRGTGSSVLGLFPEAEGRS